MARRRSLRSEATRSYPLLILLVFGFRLFNAFSLSTFYQPDEYFQALEPGFIQRYGYGFVTWEWKLGIRGALVAYIYSNLFRLADWLDMDILTVAKVFQAAVAAAGDIFTYLLARKLGEDWKSARYALFASLMSISNWLMITRPFTNTFEMVLTTAALTYWPFTSTTFISWPQFVLASFYAQLAILLRPTNGVLWLPLGVALLGSLGIQHKYKQAMLVGLVSAALTLVVQGFNLQIDRAFYGDGAFPLLSFLTSNFGARASHYYGVMPWFFYLASGIPMLTLNYLPLVVYGILQQGLSSTVSMVIAVQVFIYSTLAHKEIRFLYFLLPLLHIVVGRVGSRHKRAFLVLTLAALPGMWYVGTVHQRGVVDVINHVRAAPEIKEVTFLMPCHSTPWRSHLRRPELVASFLTCEPPVMLPIDERAAYVDEADQFYADYWGFLDAHPEKLTESIVVFDVLLDSIGDGLAQKGYIETARFFNSHFHGDWRRKGDVVVLTRGP